MDLLRLLAPILTAPQRPRSRPNTRGRVCSAPPRVQRQRRRRKARLAAGAPWQRTLTRVLAHRFAAMIDQAGR